MDEEKKVKRSTSKKSETKKTTKATVSKNTAKKVVEAKSTGTKKTVSKKSNGAKKSDIGKTLVSNKSSKKASTASKKTTTKKSPSTPKTTKTVEKKVLESEVIQTVEAPVKTVLKPSVSPVNLTKDQNEDHAEETKKVVFETRKTIKKVVPISSYLIAAIIVVWVIIIAYVGYELSRRHQENLYQEGYFIHENIDIKKISLEEAKNVSHNSTKATFILFNYRGYEETYDLEKDIWKIVQEYHLENDFYYVDLTDENGSINCDLACVINTGLNHTKFKNVPVVAYYERGTLVDVAQREDVKILEAADFVKLLDMYEFRK